MNPDARRRRLLIAASIGGLILLILVGIGVYGLIRGPQTTPPPDPGPTSATTAAPSPTVTGGAEPGRVPVFGGPEDFARAVASALFAWDTTGGYGPADYAQTLVDVGAADELEALASDIRSYLPSTQAWAQLRQYATRQWLTIDTAVVPGAWATAVEQAAPGQLPDGATAYTITGTRHREGIWGTRPEATSRPVAFTVFIACTPPTPGRGGSGMCELLRLSQIDNPLR